jgi:tetratricopeptide (TPR) repeat protein
MSQAGKARENPYEEGLRLSRLGRHADAIDRFEAALARAPDDPRILFALGNTARALGMVAPAEMFYRRVLSADPSRLEALVNLGNLLRANANASAACDLLLPALERNPDTAALWLASGLAFRDLGDLARAESHFREALAREPTSVPALSNLAEIRADLGDRNEAMALYDEALKREPGNGQVRLNRAVLRLLLGDLAEGWRDYAGRLKLENKVPRADHKLPPWTGGPLRNKRLLVTAEQGVGDQIMFASLVPELAAAAAREEGGVLLECEPRLVPLFARSFASVRVHPWSIETIGGVAHSRYGWLKAAGGANAAIEIGTLPRYLRRTKDRFPNPHAYLVPDKAEQVRWCETLRGAGERPFIGICWRSSDICGDRAIQFAPRAAWAAFLARQPGTIVSLQYDAQQEEIAALAQSSGREIFIPPGLDQKNEIDRTTALMIALDCVVSAPTAVSWMSAGLGVTTLKVLLDTAWTAFGEPFEPFAPACRTIAGDTRGDWTNAFAKASDIIAKLPR